MLNTRRRYTFVLATLTLAVAAQVRPVAAQTPTKPQSPAPAQAAASKPYRGIFGGSQRSDPGVNQLALNLSIYEERGNLGARIVPGDPTLPTTDGILDGLLASLTYDRRAPRSTVSLLAEGHFRYYRDLKQTAPTAWRAELGASRATSSRTSLRFGQSVSYSPYFSVPAIAASPAGTDLLDPSTVGLPVRDDGLVRNDLRFYLTSFAMDHQVSQRWVFSFDTRFSDSDIDLAGADVRDLRVGASVGRRMSQHLTMRFGYAYRIGNLSANTAATRAETQDIDLGFDYRVPLFKSRKTTLSFGAGSSRLSVNVPGQSRIVGRVNLRRDLPKRWFIEADYLRGFRFAAGFGEAWFSDTISGRLGGNVGRRVELGATGGYVLGKVGAALSTFNSWQASAQFRIALARYLALDGGWMTYRHVINEDVPLLFDIARRFDRNAVRVNLTIWLPLAR